MWRRRLMSIAAVVGLPGALLWALVVLAVALWANDQPIEE
jgi:hypothetical protein